MHPVSSSRRAWLSAALTSPVWTTLPWLGLAGCGGGAGTPDNASSPSVAATDANRADPAAGEAATPGSTAPRRWRMGFGGVPPRMDVATALEGIALWAPRAEVAAIHEETPWQALLSGADPVALVVAQKQPLVQLYRAHGLKLLFVAELNDGLAREQEAPQLRALGRSLQEPAVQAAWRSYAAAVARVLEPDWLCLAAETNLVRSGAPGALYGAVVHTARAAAADIRAAGLARTPLLVSSVQVETAWGRLPGQDGRFAGIAADLEDFAFSDVLGLSSYPFLAYDRPQAIPADHYSRLLQGRSGPVMVSECGWSSVPVGTASGTTADQAAYLLRHAELLDGIGAEAMLQLLFADLDLPALTQPAADTVALVAQIGLTDPWYRPKPAQATWDQLRTRRLA